MRARYPVAAAVAAVATAAVAAALLADDRDDSAAAVVVDERRGSLLGVRFGDSEAAVRERLGPPTDDAPGVFPEGEDYTGPPAIPSPRSDQRTRRMPTPLHYGDTAYLVSPTVGVFSMSTLEGDARTRAGAAVGDELARVRERYDGARCSESVAGEPVFGGETPMYPWCRVIVDGTRVFFGGDPIRSITLTRYEPAMPPTEAVAARVFDRHPLYWVGVQFEQWDLERVDLERRDFVSFIYGTCEIPAGSDAGCAPPLAIQIQPLCAHLRAVARDPAWKRRRVRGAPVGTIDSAPVLFASRVQVKVYRGQGTDPGLPMRALRALRSANEVPPVVDADDPIPPAPRDVLAGRTACS